MATNPNYATASIGHNSGSIADMAVEELSALIEPRLERIDKLTISASRAFAADADSAGKCADMIKIIRAEENEIDKHREQVKRPYLDATRAIDGEAKKTMDRLSRARAEVSQKLDSYNREERMKAEAERRRQEELRRAAEQAAREAQLSEDAAPVVLDIPAAPPAPTRIEGDLGAKVISKTVYRHEIISVRELPDDILNNSKVLEAIDKVIAARIKAGDRKIAGVNIIEDIKTEVR